MKKWTEVPNILKENKIEPWCCSHVWTWKNIRVLCMMVQGISRQREHCLSRLHILVVQTSCMTHSHVYSYTGRRCSLENQLREVCMHAAFLGALYLLYYGNCRKASCQRLWKEVSTCAWYIFLLVLNVAQQLRASDIDKLIVTWIFVENLWMSPWSRSGDGASFKHPAERFASCLQSSLELDEKYRADPIEKSKDMLYGVYEAIKKWHYWWLAVQMHGYYLLNKSRRQYVRKLILVRYFHERG